MYTYSRVRHNFVMNTTEAAEVAKTIHTCAHPDKMKPIKMKGKRNTFAENSNNICIMSCEIYEANFMYDPSL